MNTDNFIKKYFDVMRDENTGAYKDVDGDWIEYQKSTTPPSSVSGLKWVKASERLPEPHIDIYFKVNGVMNIGFFQPKRKEFYSAKHGHAGYIEGLENIEWLEEATLYEIDNLGSDGELINILLVNALRQLNDEQRATLIASLFVRTDNWEYIVSEINRTNEVKGRRLFVASKEQPSSLLALRSSISDNSIQEYRDETKITKEEWNESEQATGTATIHLSDNDSRWGKTVSEGAQFIFHKMADGTIDFEVYAPNGLNDPSNFDGVFNETAANKLREFLNDKTTY